MQHLLDDRDGGPVTATLDGIEGNDEQGPEPGRTRRCPMEDTVAVAPSCDQHPAWTGAGLLGNDAAR